VEHLTALLSTCQQGAWKGSVGLPEVFWAEFRLQELEKLLSPNGIFQHFVDSKSPASNSSLTRFLTVPTHTKTHYTYRYTLIWKTIIIFSVYFWNRPGLHFPERCVIWYPGIGRIRSGQERVIVGILLSITQQTTRPSKTEWGIKERKKEATKGRYILVKQACQNIVTYSGVSTY